MNVVQPMDPEGLRTAAAEHRLTEQQSRAVAVILAALEVVHGDGEPVPDRLAGPLLARILDTYVGELRRLGAPTEPGPRSGDAAAARRRAEAAARRAAETEAVAADETVARLDERRAARSHDAENDRDE